MCFSIKTVYNLSICSVFMAFESFREPGQEWQQPRQDLHGLPKAIISPI